MLNFVGQYFGEFGIPIHTKRFAKALLKHIPVNLVQLSGDVDELRPQYPEDEMDDEFFSHFDSPDPDWATLIFYYPNEYERWLFSDRRNMGYYIFECTKIPQPFVEAINELDAVCTASQWGVDILKANGVHIPCHVVHGGVDTDYFNPTNRNPGDGFKILHVGKCEQRKSTEEIIHAFVVAFRDNPQVTLTISADNVFTNVNVQDVVDQLLSAHEATDMRDRIHVIGFVDDIRTLYHSHHLAVFAPKAEGIGLPITEAMACGMPVIAPNHSGMSEYVSEENAIVLTGYVETDIWDPHFFPVAGAFGTWQAPDIDEIVEQMQWAYSNYDDAQRIGIQAASWMNANYTWDKVAQEFIERFV